MTELTTAPDGAPIADSDIFLIRKAATPGVARVVGQDLKTYIGAGPAGADGAPGAAGAQGPQGPQGAQGPAGADGTNGIAEAPNNANTYGRKGAAWLALGTAAANAVTDFLSSTGNITTGGNITSTGNITATGIVSIINPAGNSSLNITGDISASISVYRYSNDNGATTFQFRKARGTAAVPAVVLTNDQIGLFQFYGYTGAAYLEAARLTTTVIDPAPGVGAMGGRFDFFTTSSGSTGLAARVRIDENGLSMSGGNIVLDKNRNYRARSYLKAALPGADSFAGSIAYASDATGGAVPVWYDGAIWRRFSDRSDATGAVATVPYRVGMFFTTAPTASETLLLHSFTDAATFADEWVGAVGKAGTNPAAVFTMDVQKNGVSVGSIAISIAGVVTFTTTGTTVTFAVGDVLKIVAPATVGTPTNVSITLKGAV